MSLYYATLNNKSERDVSNPLTQTTKVHRGLSAGNEKARHRRPTAHARARYRCFLPDLAGLAGVRRAGPMPDLFNSNIPIVLFPFRAESPTIAKASNEFNGVGPYPAIRDCSSAYGGAALL